MDLYENRRMKLKLLVLGAAAAGKTSLLRRRIYGTFAGVRQPTRGSDFYVQQLKQGLVADEEDEAIDIDIHLQLWDTPGRERFYTEQKPKYTAFLSDSFFDKADAVMLVYDMTSSTSFTQLLRWYADLMQIRSNQKDKLSFPILIVGNKLDAYQAMQQRASTDIHPRQVPQRNVLGFGKKFRGVDFQYEYRVSSPVQSPLLSHHKQYGHNGHAQQRRKHHHTPAHLTTPQVSSFLANREHWTEDDSYLTSLLLSEEGSTPDLEMVLLWCLRNGLKHMKVSAASGQGVDEAFDTLTNLALEHRLEIAYQDANQYSNSIVDVKSTENPSLYPNTSDTGPFVDHHPLPLDLQARYRPKEEDCCFGILRPPNWLRLRR